MTLTMKKFSNKLNPFKRSSDVYSVTFVSDVKWQPTTATVIDNLAFAKNFNNVKSNG